MRDFNEKDMDIVIAAGGFNGWFNAMTTEYYFVGKLLHIPFISENPDIFKEVIVGVNKLKYASDKYSYMANHNWIRFLPTIHNDMITMQIPISAEQKKACRQFARMLEMRVIFQDG